MKSYKFRLYPNKKQEEQIQKTFGCSRFVYNYYLNKKIENYKLSKEEQVKLSKIDCNNHCNQQLKNEFEWLREVDKWAITNAIYNLDTAYQNFFGRVKKQSKQKGFPKFKSKRKSKLSYKTNFSNNNIDILDDKHIKLPKLKSVKCIIHREVLGNIKSATISQNSSGQYFVSVLTDYVAEHKPQTGSVIGFDLGLKELLIDSNGNSYPNPKYLAKSQNKLSYLQKLLSRKPKDSNNYKKNKLAIAKLHQHIVNQRSDLQHKISSKLINENDVICFETLKVRNMLKNHKLAKSISDVAWSELTRQITYKCDWYGKLSQQIDGFYPSSQLCNECGYKNVDVKKLAVREWICPNCGIKHNRDVNAAKNILTEGLRLLSI